MALTVEDGTGRADAESYISVAEATTYHDNRGNAAWAALSSDTQREQMLRRATDYMVAMYRERWAGYRERPTQALDWPRYDVPMPDAAAMPDSMYGAYYPYTVVPEVVKRACAELALRALDGDLLADLEPPVIEETVGPITTRYAQGSRQTKAYPQIDAMLAPLLQGANGSIKVVRA
jgi:hypothetical protein